jgi:hypothetical protein
MDVVMKRLVVLFVFTVFACIAGCGTEDISQEGKIVQVVLCTPMVNAPDAVIQKAANAISDIPSKAPILERFEWGQANYEGYPKSYCYLATFKNPQSIHDPVYTQVINDEVRSVQDATGRYTGGLGTMNMEFLFHDATPQVRTTTHRRLRCVDLVRLEEDTTPAEMKRI